jgi:hypothetical protein
VAGLDLEHAAVDGLGLLEPAGLMKPEGGGHFMPDVESWTLPGPW